MKVNISVFGRFYAFDLAKQLDEAGMLNKLITTYPKFKVEEWGIDANKVVSEVPLEIFNRLNSKSKINSNWLNSYLKIIHAKNSVKYLDGCDIFIGFSSSSLETLIEARKKGIITVLERASAHYSYQQNILIDEFKNQNLKFHPNHYSWKRELAEYDITNYISIASSFVKKSFIKYGFSEEKLLVNPYGVNLENFSPYPKKDNIFRIIYSGTASIRKGFHYLLQAFYELDLENCELWHMGAINDEMMQIIEKYKHPNLKLKGPQSQNELNKFYSQGSVFVLPSLEDGFGLVVPQAIACGLPVICTTNTGANDLITHEKDGFIIPIQNVEEIKKKILFLYNNEDKCKEMGQRAKKKIENKYSWNDYGLRYIKNLNDILSNAK